MRRFGRLVAAAGAAAVVVGVSAGSAAASPGASGAPAFPVLKSPVASGYAAVPAPAGAAQSFTHVQVTFTIPSVICPVSPNGSTAEQRAGLDGISDGTIERVGISENCEVGIAPYTAWYQMYPAPRVILFDPSPGDKVGLSVTFAGGVYTFTVADLTTGKTYSATATCATVCDNSSAQVTVGLPGLPPPTLLDFGTVHFSGIVVKDSEGHIGGLSSPYWDTVKLVQTGHPRSVAGPLTTSPAPPAQAFVDRWKA
jgi:Peptidase A4 family